MDVLRIKYDIYLYTNEGEKITLNNLVQSATLEEQKGQLAQKASLTLYNKAVSYTHLSQMFTQLRTCVLLEANYRRLRTLFVPP